MELLIAFLIAFGVVSTGDASKLNANQANDLLVKNNLQNDYIIWEVELDEF